MNAPRLETSNKWNTALISCLATGIVALMIALAQATQPGGYDKDQAFIKASIQQNATQIASLTTAVQQLTVQEAQMQTEIQNLTDRTNQNFPK